MKTTVYFLFIILITGFGIVARADNREIDWNDLHIRNWRPSCAIFNKEIYSQLDPDRDFIDPPNPAYRRIRPEAYCKLVFKKCGPESIHEVSLNFAVGYDLLFVRIDESINGSTQASTWICRKVKPTATGPGGADDTYYVMGQKP